MPGRAWTRRLGVLAGSAPNVWNEVFRAQAAGVTVLRDIIVTNAGQPSGAEAALRVRPLTKAGEWWLWYVDDLATGTAHIELRQVVEPNEALEFYSTITGAYVAATGYVFE